MSRSVALHFDAKLVLVLCAPEFTSASSLPYNILDYKNCLIGICMATFDCKHEENAVLAVGLLPLLAILPLKSDYGKGKKHNTFC